MAELSIITVNHRSSARLLVAQHALSAKPAACDFEWIVVNHSPEDPVVPLPAFAGRMRVIEQGNVGFGRGVNAGARVARAPVLFLANPDLVFDGPLLDAGLARLAEATDVGLLGPRLVSPDGSVQRTARRFYTWPTAMFARLPGRDLFPEPRFWRDHLMRGATLDQPQDVDWLIGAALFVRRDALRDAAGPEPVFDPRYFLYFEDVDLCMDFWSRGWRVRFDPTLVAKHEYMRASKHLPSPAAWIHGYSFLKFVLKWRGLPQRSVAERLNARRGR